MKALTLAFAMFITILTAAADASAWDGPTLWYESAVGGQGGPAGPGGGGIIGTGGATDHNITCAHCHIKGEAKYGTIGANVTFNPPIGATYKLGQKYQVTVALSGEYLGKSGCDQYMKNINGFAASFEDDSGKNAGVITAANGTSTSCPSSIAKDYAGQTFTYSDCHAVIGEGENATTWTFEWTAPSDAKTMTMYYGVVDGDCMMNSMMDDVKVGTVKLGGGMAMRDTPNGNRALAFAGFLPCLALTAAIRRRRRADRSSPGCMEQD